MHVPGGRVKHEHVPAVQHGRHIDVQRLELVGQEGGCRATYYNHAKKLGPSVELPNIRLNNQPPEQTAANLLDLLRRRFGMLGSDEPQ